MQGQYLPNIAFIGRAGSGKDTAAELLIETLGYRRLGFADLLKDVAATLWGDQARTDRNKLQALGMAVREIDQDTWVNGALAKLTEHKGQARLVGSMPSAEMNGPYFEMHPVAVTDCRFPNEVRALRSHGFVLIRIEADRDQRIRRLTANGKLGEGDWENHISETILDDVATDYTVYNLTDKAQLLDDTVKCIDLERRAKV